MTDKMPKKTYGVVIPVYIGKTDKVGDIGKLTTAVARKISTLITSQFAADPDDYDINIAITMEAKNLD